VVPLSRRHFLAAGAAAVVSGCADGPSAEQPGDGAARATLGPREPQALVTRWATDPYSLGAYSFLPVGATPDDRAALQEPVHGRLLLAGEHTDLAAPATTHGALVSGRRAAARVISSGADGVVAIVGSRIRRVGCRPHPGRRRHRRGRRRGP
jgi:polyamine oxidase